MIMFSKQLTRSGQNRRFTINQDADGDGWEVRIEQDDAVVQQARYRDWHRVERALTLIARDVSELEALGWQETAAAF
jgi:hypothetical protein